MKVSATESQQDSGKAGSASSGQMEDGGGYFHEIYLPSHWQLTKKVTPRSNNCYLILSCGSSFPHQMMQNPVFQWCGIQVTTNPYPCGMTIICQRNITGNWINDSSIVGLARELSSSVGARQRKRRSPSADEEEESSSWWNSIVGSLTTSDNLRFLTLVGDSSILLWT